MQLQASRFTVEIHAKEVIGPSSPWNIFFRTSKWGEKRRHQQPALNHKKYNNCLYMNDFVTTVLPNIKQHIYFRQRATWWSSAPDSRATTRSRTCSLQTTSAASRLGQNPQLCLYTGMHVYIYFFLTIISCPLIDVLLIWWIQALPWPYIFESAKFSNMHVFTQRSVHTS
jgi:hypothetical protein